MTVQEIIEKFPPDIPLLQTLTRLKHAGAGALHIMRWVVMQIATEPLEPRWVEQLGKARKALPGGNLVLLGTRGSGKSQMATSILADQCLTLSWDVPRAPRMLLLSEMLLQLRATFGPDSDTTEARVMAELAEASLLIVDELQDGSGTTFADQRLTDVIASRYKNAYPTVFCANVAYENLPEALGPSIADRFSEGSSGVLLCDWPSVREKVVTLPKLAELLEALPSESKARRSWVKGGGA